jgi:hypothetical protein
MDMNSIEIAIKKFYKNKTRDKSHDWNHVLDVKNNSLMLMKFRDFTEEQINIVTTAALGHDIWDHKYFDSDDEINKLKSEFIDVLLDHNYTSGNILSIITIIDNISFSKEYKLRNEKKTIDLDDDILILRNIVSDADKLESVGEKGIKRMIDYRIHKDNTHILEDVQQHFKNKLSLLVKDNYIITPYAKNLAILRLREMENIINDNLILQDFINNYILYNYQ